ncbi:hypothetical protein PK28_07435 [Hymenobacter sp. DG25B]|uniref:hypothetical protein n=1 Tax=Hymenobacter sp. DG25B TaxID=1385664 RepID=UPI000540E257|nr:hypothetical protein [Hymenobacter sp. DG25B]AIZ63564.1 hypothetical protein PK28_07435 [Hymenobacter sp. DG25B]
MPEFRNRILLSLLLGALLLSAGLNVYFLQQIDARPLNYELETGLPVSVTELELAQARAELLACQRGRQAGPDSVHAVHAAF